MLLWHGIRVAAVLRLLSVVSVSVGVAADHSPQSTVCSLCCPVGATGYPLPLDPNVSRIASPPPLPPPSPPLSLCLCPLPLLNLERVCCPVAEAEAEAKLFNSSTSTLSSFVFGVRSLDGFSLSSAALVGAQNADSAARCEMGEREWEKWNR